MKKVKVRRGLGFFNKTSGGMKVPDYLLIEISKEDILICYKLLKYGKRGGVAEGQMNLSS